MFRVPYSVFRSVPCFSNDHTCLQVLCLHLVDLVECARRRLSIYIVSGELLDLGVCEVFHYCRVMTFVHVETLAGDIPLA